MATGVSITDHAVEKIKQRLAAEKREGQGLRVKVVGGGCSGLNMKRTVMWHLLCGLGRAQGAWFEKLVPRYDVRVKFMI